MKPDDSGPYPYKPAADPLDAGDGRRAPRYMSDPFIAAIARNPRPLIMMGVGLFGMILLMIVNSFGSAEPQRSSSTGSSDAATVLDMDNVAPAESPAPPATSVQLPFDEALTEPAATLPMQSEQPDPILPPVPVRTYITVIIDDVGNSLELGERAVALPGNVTYAVLPHTPHGAALAERAYSLGKEVMLHAPMSNLAHRPLGPGALTDTLDRAEFMRTLDEAIAAIPHLKGINNHMGSALTEREEQMNWVMESLSTRDLYFVDSLTTARSVAGRVAREHDIPTLTRNVFLDNEQTFENIDREFQRLLTLAEQTGSAVGIGHPYPETLEYLEQAIPALAQRDIELLKVSEMIELREKSEVTP